MSPHNQQLPETFGYGVFSCLSIELNDSDVEETLYFFHEDKLSAIVWMARFIVFRSFQVIPYQEWVKLGAALNEMCEKVNDQRMVNVTGVAYYIRPLTEDEAKRITVENPLASQ